MDRRNYYYGQYVQEDELDEGFDGAEQADWDQVKDLGLRGICVPAYDVAGSPPTPPAFASPPSWYVQQNTTPDWNVRVTTGYGHDKDGKRLALDPPTTVFLDCEEDYLGNPNSVAAGKERWISVFLKYDKALSDPRIDDLGATVYFVEDESYELEVRQGPEETAPATTKPSLDADALLLVDINIDENTGTSGILDADRSFLRTEHLINLDLSTPLGSGAWLYARNLQEAFYLFAVELAAASGLWDTEYIRRDGGNTITGDIEPDTDDTRFLGGAKAYFRSIFTSAFAERPTDNSFGSVAEPDSSLDDLPTYPHRTTVVKTMSAVTGDFRRHRDLIGRDHRLYHVEREDFNWPNGWTGTPGVHTRWKQILTSGGTLVHNPSTFAQLLAGGFAQSNVFASGDGVDVYADGLIYRADLEPYVVWCCMPQTLTSTAAVFVGMKGATGNFFGLMYDPTNLWGYGTSGTNLWAVYDDGTNTPIAYNTGNAFTVGVLTRMAVAIEWDDTDSKYYLVWYKDNSSIHNFNLTDGGGTYQSVALGEVFDLYYLLRETAAATSRVLLDYYEGIQNLDT